MLKKELLSSTARYYINDKSEIVPSSNKNTRTIHLTTSIVNNSEAIHILDLELNNIKQEVNIKGDIYYNVCLNLLLNKDFNLFKNSKPYEQGSFWNNQRLKKINYSKALENYKKYMQ